MVKKRSVEILEEDVLPHALILGGGKEADWLEESLNDQGCRVTKKGLSVSSLLDREKDKYDYIFQFGEFLIVDEIIKRYLNEQGKFLFIETEKEENLKSLDNVKILRVGEIKLWQRESLIEKILRTIFLTKESVIIDARRRSSVPLSKPEAKNIQKTRTIETTGHRDKDQILVQKKPTITFKRLSIFALLMFICLACVSGFIYWRILNLGENFTRFQANMASGNFREAVLNIQDARQEISSMKKMYNVFSRIFFPFRDTGIVKDAGVFLSVSDSLLANTNELLISLSAATDGNSGFPTRISGISKTQITELSEKIRQMKLLVVSSRSEIEEMKMTFFPKESLIPVLTKTSEKLIAADEILPIVEKLLFPENAKTYLILFQNNMELRPTGGFIGSYGLVTIQNGKILDFKIEDVYTADGQLRGHVDPPPPIRKYLSQPHYYLRDSNFDPDFAPTAQKAAWFLQKELGTNADGVIGINLFFVQKLLRVTGPLTLSDFGGEVINADNFFQKAHSFVQDKFFSGSTQKKDFLKAVVNAIFAKFEGGQSNKLMLELFPRVKESLEEKSILLASFDEDTQKMFEEKGFAGRIGQVRCPESGEPSCFADYLSINEANLGVNKANYFINKSVTVEKKISANGEISSLITVSYENTSIPEINPNNAYVNYLRLLVPAASRLNSVTLNSVPISPGEIDIENYSPDKTVFGFLVRITEGGRGKVKVSYTLPNLLTINQSSYTLLYQKQGGDKISPLVLSVTHPAELKLKAVNFKSTTSHEGEIYYTTDTSVDRIFAIGKEK